MFANGVVILVVVKIKGDPDRLEALVVQVEVVGLVANVCDVNVSGVDGLSELGGTWTLVSLVVLQVANGLDVVDAEHGSSSRVGLLDSWLASLGSSR